MFLVWIVFQDERRARQVWRLASADDMIRKSTKLNGKTIIHCSDHAWDLDNPSDNMIALSIAILSGNVVVTKAMLLNSMSDKTKFVKRLIDRTKQYIDNDDPKIEVHSNRVVADSVPID